MSKEEFLSAIEVRISALPQTDIRRFIDYYGEMIDDYMEDGLSEEEAVFKMGTVDEIVSQILMDTPIQTLVQADAQPARARKVWEIILLILGAPIWLSLLLAAFVVILALYIVVWAIVVSFYVVALSLALALPAGIFCAGCMVFAGEWVQMLLFSGAGLFCAGLAIPVGIGCNIAAKYCWKGTKWTVKKILSMFVRKGAEQ